MRRLATLLFATAILLSGCSGTEGRIPVPDCDLRSGSSVLLLAQAVPTAELIPCVDELMPGWSVSAVTVRRGSAALTLESDDLGGEFMSVTLGEACPARVDEEKLVVPGAIVNRSRVVRVTGPDQHDVAVVPESGDNVVAANGLLLELSRAGVDAEIIPVGGPVETRVDAALAAGRSAVIVDDLSSAEGVVVLVEPDSGIRTSHAASELVELYAGLVTGDETTIYQGGWYYRFAGGCVTYEFDAAGPDAADLDEDVPRAVSFVARPTLDRFTRANVGVRLDP